AAACALAPIPAVCPRFLLYECSRTVLALDSERVSQARLPPICWAYTVGSIDRGAGDGVEVPGCASKVNFLALGENPVNSGERGVEVDPDAGPALFRCEPSHFRAGDAVEPLIRS